MCALGPIVVLGVALRFQGRSNLEGARSLRIQERVERLNERLGAEETRLDVGAAALVELIRETPELRAEVASDNASRSEVLEQDAGSLAESASSSPSFGRRISLGSEVGRVASLTGLDAVLLLNSDGVVLAASHFAGDVGRRDPGLVQSIASREGSWIADIAFSDGSRRVLLRRLPLELGNRTVWAVSASVIHARWLGVEGTQVVFAESSGDPGLAWGTGTPIVGAGEVPFDTDTVVPLKTLPMLSGVPDRDTASTMLLAGFAEGDASALLRTWDRAFLWALVAAGVLAFVLGSWMSARLAAPVERLTQTARTVHLGRLTARFPESAGGEVGRLGRFLNGMLERLREGVERLTEAERRATRGEVARQINHDIRNGLIPIRNVLDHLKQARAEGPGSLAQIFDERGETLDGSVAYLSELADQYRGVAEHGTKVPVDVVPVIRELLSASRYEGVVWDKHETRAWVSMDAVSFRRVMENLLGNALDAVDGDASLVEVGVETEDTVVTVLVKDQGSGLTPEEQSKVFEPFFTRKTGGTGLGLPIVRRLVSDVGGSVQLDSAPGLGTRVRVVLAAVAPVDDPQQVPASFPD